MYIFVLDVSIFYYKYYYYINPTCRSDLAPAVLCSFDSYYSIVFGEQTAVVINSEIRLRY